MTTKFKTWIAAARLRTLPLSVSGILTGTGFAIRHGFFDGKILVFALLTTLGLQILSNFANDYGDGVKGTDNENRIGPVRALQSGIISNREMKTAIILTAAFSFICAVLLILISFGEDEFFYILLFLLLGMLAIAAAIKYTVGKSAYGYYGMGDIFVFLFFGLLSTAGSYFLYSKQLSPLIWVLAAVIGLLSVAVINLNNMRDRENDFRSGKHTLAVKLGSIKAKKYHFFLILSALALILIYIISEPKPTHLLLFLIFIPLGMHLKKVRYNKNEKDLDPELKKVALSTAFFALLYLLTGWM